MCVLRAASPLIYDVLKTSLLVEPSNPFNTFHRYEEDINNYYMRMIIPFSHAVLAASITGLAFGVNYRAKVVIDELDLIKKLTNKFKGSI